METSEKKYINQKKKVNRMKREVKNLMEYLVYCKTRNSSTVITRDVMHEVSITANQIIVKEEQKLKYLERRR